MGDVATGQEWIGECKRTIGTVKCQTGKPEAAGAVVAPDDGHEDARNMSSCIKRQAINLRNCCIWLVDSFESTRYSCQILMKL